MVVVGFIVVVMVGFVIFGFESVGFRLNQFD